VTPDILKITEIPPVPELVGVFSAKALKLRHMLEKIGTTQLIASQERGRSSVNVWSLLNMGEENHLCGVKIFIKRGPWTPTEWNCDTELQIFIDRNTNKPQRLLIVNNQTPRELWQDHPWSFPEDDRGRETWQNRSVAYKLPGTINARFSDLTTQGLAEANSRLDFAIERLYQDMPSLPPLDTD